MIDKQTLSALERAEGCFKAAAADILEEQAATDTADIDVNMLDGAVTHAEEGLRRLREIRTALLALAAETERRAW